MIGRLLSNRYEIVKEIGSGRIAWVYLARDVTSGKEVAVKVLFPQFAGDPAYLSRFYNEARLAMVLESPHIVKILDYGAERDTHYLVMEYVEGDVLKDLIARNGPLPWHKALEIALQVAMALEEAHRYGIVHLGIKPQDIMITPEGTVKVLDFGLAKTRDLPSATQGGFTGSPHYLAPEQVVGAGADIRSDIYSLGAVLYEMLSGRPPFEGDNPWAIISQHISAYPPPFKTLGLDIPPQVEELVLKAMAKTPQDRFQTPEELIEAIKALLREEEAELGAPPFPSKEELYEKARQAIENEDWLTALTCLNRIQRIDPEYRDVKILAAVAGKKARLEALYKAAIEAIEEQRWDEARDELWEINVLEPGYRDAMHILAHLDEVVKAYNQGLSCWEKKDWAKAAYYFGKVHSLFPFHSQAQKLSQEAMRRAGAMGVAVPLAISWREQLPITMAYLRGRISTIQARLYALVSSLTSRISASSLWPQSRIARYLPVAGLLTLMLLIGLLFLWQHQSQGINPTPSPSPVETTVTVAPTQPYPGVVKPTTQEPERVEELWREGETLFNQQDWTGAIEKLATLHREYPDFKPALVKELLCSSYLYRGREALSLVSEGSLPSTLRKALQDFRQGLQICTDDSSLKWEETLARLCLEAYTLYQRGLLDEAVAKWEEVYSLDPEYLGGELAQQLYEAYLTKAANLEEEGKTEEALALYQKALELDVPDHSEALARKEALLTPTPTPTPKPRLVYKYPAPRLLSPADGAIFHGKYTEIFLEWEPVGKLAPDEFYNVTVMRFWVGQPRYWGDGIRETRWKVPILAGYKEADRDLFYWWVVVKKATTTTPEGKPDGPPISPQSETWRFYWY